jgi:hypothetical protein
MALDSDHSYKALATAILQSDILHPNGHATGKSMWHGSLVWQGSLLTLMPLNTAALSGAVKISYTSSGGKSTLACRAT